MRFGSVRFGSVRFGSVRCGRDDILLLAHPARHCSDGGAVINLADRHRHTELRTESREQLCGHQGVPSKTEKIILHVDPGSPQELLPDGGDFHFQRIAWWDVAAGLQVTRVVMHRLGPDRQTAIVNLPRAVVRNRFQGDQPRRDHRPLQTLSEKRSQLLSRHRLVSPRGVEADNSTILWGGIPTTDRGLRDPRMLGDRCFDFPQFNTVTAELDLTIAATQKFEPAIAQPADDVSAAVPALRAMIRAGNPREKPVLQSTQGTASGKKGCGVFLPQGSNERGRTGDEAICGQILASQVTSRDTGATDPQLTGNALRGRSSLMIEDRKGGTGDRAADRDRIINLRRHVLYQ